MSRRMMAMMDRDLMIPPILLMMSLVRMRATMRRPVRRRRAAPTPGSRRRKYALDRYRIKMARATVYDVRKGECARNQRGCLIWASLARGERAPQTWLADVADPILALRARDGWHARWSCSSFSRGSCRDRGAANAHVSRVQGR